MTKAKEPKEPKPPKAIKVPKPERPARAWRLPQNGNLVIGAPYRKDFVTALKECIHYSYREFDAQTKNWIVYPDFAETALSLFTEFYGDHGGEYWSNGWVKPAEPDIIIDHGDPPF